MLIEEDQFEPAPRCANVNCEFVLGLGRSDEKVVILLDIERIFRSIEICDFEDQAAGVGT